MDIRFNPNGSVDAIEGITSPDGRVFGKMAHSERMGEGLMLTDVTGLHAGANPISGDFSLSAKGFRVRGGRKAEAVNQITVAGNFYRLLESVVAVGSDLEFGFPGSSRFGSPSLLISELAVAGK